MTTTGQPRANAADVAWAVMTIPLLVLYTVVFGLPAIPVAIIDRSGRGAATLARNWARALLWTWRVRVVVEGREHVPAQAAVYAANHGSALDIPLVFAHLPVDFRILHKRSLYRIPVLGWFLYLAGHIDVDRTNPFSARRSLKHAGDCLRGGASIVTFPEGTRGSTAEIRRFKRGPVVMAIEAQAPLVPVSLIGVKQVAPRGILTLVPGTVTLRLHPAIPTAGKTVADAESLNEQVRAAVAAGCREDERA